VTGHGKLRPYLHRFGITDNPMCPCEKEEQTSDHVIFQYKRFNSQRNDMIKQIKTDVVIGLRQMKNYSIIILKFL
jgi:hypothetical protein